MRTMTKSRAGRIFHRVKEIWAELDYAQARTLEITTGIPSLTRQERPRTGASVSDLESLYALQDHDGSATDTRRPIGFVGRSTGDSRQAGSRQCV